MKAFLNITLLSMACILSSCATQQSMNTKTTVMRGDYMGQTPPGDSAVLFGPHIVSSALNDRDFAVTPDGNEFFFCREAGNFTYTTIFYARRVNGIWTVPEVFEYCTNPQYKYVEPHISADGLRLYFISNQPCDKADVGNEDIWFSDKIDGKWSKPENLGAPVNTKSKEYFPSVTKNGTIYFTHYDSTAKDEFIYRSRYTDGAYLKPEKLGPNVNIGDARYNAFVASDESYIIIPAYGMPDTYGGTDYYISFRDNSDNWSKPVNMGPEINSSNPREWSASVTTDKKYIFFMSARMGMSKIEKLSNESLHNFFQCPPKRRTQISTGSVPLFIED